jgi:hypothetical protein
MGFMALATAEMTMNDLEINVGRDYSRTPGGRYIRHGAFSGEDFRDNKLVPALKNHDHVTVILDGTAGYAGSFLEEAFGGLIREGHFKYADLQKKLTVKALDQKYEIYRRMAEQYMKDAASRGSDRVA